MGEPATSAEEFGPYLVLERLGVGGMATVHRALERGIEGLERIVAVKRLLPHLATDASLVRAFVREARLASLLQHSNICQIFALGRVGATYFISMEYVDGYDVRRLLRQARTKVGPPPLGVTLALIRQVCDALDYAHRRADVDGTPLGLVHRDVTPANLLLTRTGHIKVIDFGIAKAQATHLRTGTGKVKGKVAYMAPEAVAGRELDHRSDLYSLGVVFHELLTARPLFAQKNDYETLLRVQRGDIPRPSSIRPELPRSLDDIVLKALAHDPDQRWASAAELREALLEVPLPLPGPSTPDQVAAWCAEAFIDGVPLAQGGEEPEELPWGRDQTASDSDAMVILDDVPDFGIRKSDEPTTTPDGVAMPRDQRWIRVDTIETHAVPPPSRPGHISRAPRVVEPLGNALASTTNTPAAGTPAAATDAASRETQPLAGAVASVSRPPPSASRPPPSASRPPPSASRPPPSASRPPPSMSSPLEAAREAASSTSAQAGDAESSTSRQETEIGVPPGAITEPHAAVPEDAATTDPSMPAIRATLDPATTADAIAAVRRRSPSRFLGLGLGVVIAAALGGAAVTLGVLAARMGSSDSPAAPTAPTGPTGAPIIVPATPTTGNLTVAVHPNDVSIVIDDQPPHAGSPYTIEVAPGEHRVEIRREGYETWVTSVDIKAGVIQTVQAALVEDSSLAAPTVATLALDSAPRGLEVILDGNPLEFPTPIRMGVAPGRHEIVVRQRGKPIWSTTFIARANQSHRFHAFAPPRRGDVDAATDDGTTDDGTTSVEPTPDAAPAAVETPPPAPPDAAPKPVILPRATSPDAAPARTPPPPPPPVMPP